VIFIWNNGLWNKLLSTGDLNSEECLNSIEKIPEAKAVARVPFKITELHSQLSGHSKIFFKKVIFGRLGVKFLFSTSGNTIRK